MNRVKRYAVLALQFLLWSFLMPGQFLPLSHDLQEIYIHGQKDRTSTTVAELGTHERNHDCHSCLISHPRASAEVPKSGSSTMHSEWQGPVSAFTQCGFPGLDQEIPNKRSPPA